MFYSTSLSLAVRLGLVWVFGLQCAGAFEYEYEIGTGIYDITPQISDIVMMGMANPAQVGAGLLQRVRSRAFVVCDSQGKRIAFVSMDTGMGGIVVNNRVLEILEKEKKLVDEITGEPLYTHANLAISGTHTHSAPSGFLEYTIFQFAGSGWVENTIDAFVKGVAESIYLAHQNLQPANAYVNIGLLRDAAINRSPTAYLLNPESERKRYKYSTDHEMTLLKFASSSSDNESSKEIGMFNWFAVHPTSLNNTNVLISGDNKGYASYLFEEWKNNNMKENGERVKSSLTGQGDFVAAFAATNLGDVSPNLNGPKCRDTGLPCDAVHSTCNGRTEMCSASGPGKDMYDSCQIIGRRQYEMAKKLYNNDNQNMQQISGGIDYIHTYVRMPGLNVTSPDGKFVGTLCKPSMGESFAAGTIDGPGMFDFTQGRTTLKPFWNFIVDFLHKATPEERACQHPKAILLPTGSLDIPYPWAPDVLPLQILKLGQFVILSVPSEFTTMAGRRLREHIKAKMVKDGLLDKEKGVVVLAGLTNGYADYTTTFEEYQEQRYEAGSTIYGPHQLNAFIQEMSKLVDAMGKGVKLSPSATPEDFSDRLVHTGPSLHTDHLPPHAKYFGHVLDDVENKYYINDIHASNTIVSATFAGANPLNNLRLQQTYVKVVKCLNVACEQHSLVADDSDWETRIHVTRSREDIVEIYRMWKVEWHVPIHTQPGMYRFFLYGTSCAYNLFHTHHKFTDFVGKSKVFEIRKHHDSSFRTEQRVSMESFLK